MRPRGEQGRQPQLCRSIEIMQRNKGVIRGEDGDTNGSDNAPRNVFSLTSFAGKS
ncbi:MAG: hypothetical protein ACREC0_13230 [Methylocella sp.]